MTFGRCVAVAGNWKSIFVSSLVGASTFSMRSICLSLLCAWAGFGVFGAEAVDEFHQPPDFAFLIFVGGEQLLFVRFALDEVIVVIAAIADELALADFDDAADELVEKFAVVRDDEDRAGIGFQIILEPEQRFEVEMVGRLVEQQQVGLLRQQARQMGAHDPAAAHFAGRAVEIFFAETQSGEDLFRFGFEPIAAEFVETIVDVVMDILGVQRFDRMIGFPGFEDAAQFGELGRDGGGQFDDGFIADGRAFLRQIADA